MEQENIQLPPEVAQQFKTMQARATIADLANMDLRNEVNTLIQMLLVKLDKLQKENGDLKAKLEKNKTNLHHVTERNRGVQNDMEHLSKSKHRRKL